MAEARKSSKPAIPTCVIGACHWQKQSQTMQFSGTIIGAVIAVILQRHPITMNRIELETQIEHRNFDN